MGAGNTLFRLSPLANSPPATGYAQFDIVVGASSPAESIPVLAFDAAADEYADFRVSLPYTYAGGGLTFTIAWSAASAIIGTVRWGIAIRRIADDVEDMDTTAKTYDFNTGGFTTASASGEVVYDTIAFTAGADMDSWAVGEEAIIRVFRDGDGTSGTDDMAGDAFLHAVSCRETP